MKNSFVVIFAFVNSYCTPQAVQTAGTTVFGDESAFEQLPPRPDEEPISAEDDWVVAVSVGEMIDQPGVCMSDAKAMRSAQFIVAYNELRGLYRSDLRTWEREQEIYQRYLQGAEQEIVHWQEKSKRTWWERHSAQIGLAAGVLIGAGLSVGLVYGINQVTHE